MAHPRQYTNHLIELIDDGMLDKETVIFALLGYLSDDEVRGMMEANEFIDPYAEDDDEEDDDEEDDEEEYEDEEEDVANVNNSQY